MSRNRLFIYLPLSLLLITVSNAFQLSAHASSGFGAKIYCVMRSSGNDHESSWNAAYESIKGKKEGFFKTSPKRAAVMIVEAVVRDPDKYEGCAEFLGDMYESQAIEDQTYKKKEKQQKVGDEPLQIRKSDRYSY